MQQKSKQRIKLKGLIERLNNTIYMVRWQKRKFLYGSTLMQFIDKRTGGRYDYYPDSSPNSYDDCCNTIAVFRIRYKRLPSFASRFKENWKFYKFCQYR